MSLIGAVLAWTGVVLLAYVYIGYPVLVWGLARLRGRGVRKAEALPHVTLVISAFNEAAVIGQKLENALALDYPRERLDILVVSDASTVSSAGSRTVASGCSACRSAAARRPG